MHDGGASFNESNGVVTVFAEPTAQDLDLAGRVLLFYEEEISIRQVKAINVHLITSKSFKLQIWQEEEARKYTLQWQQLIPMEELSPTKRRNYTLNVDEPFVISPKIHRIGVYFHTDNRIPLSIPILVSNDSKPALLSPPPSIWDMEPGKTSITFDKLKFPYFIPREYLVICDKLDCGYNISQPHSPSQQPIVGSTAAAAVGEENFLLTVPFLTWVFAWLIVLTVAILVLIILIVCLFFRNKSDKDSEESSSHPQEPGEWYVVTDDPPFSLTFSDSSHNQPPSTSYRHLDHGASNPRSTPARALSDHPSMASTRVVSDHTPVRRDPGFSRTMDRGEHAPFGRSRGDRLVFDNYGYHDEII